MARYRVYADIGISQYYTDIGAYPISASGIPDIGYTRLGYRVYPPDIGYTRHRIYANVGPVYCDMIIPISVYTRYPAISGIRDIGYMTSRF
jgi:hypothetical protein